jgi:4a-hydroxytetrahydrobiopterin dehydratase
MTQLFDRTCIDLPSGTPPLAAKEIELLRIEIPDWENLGDQRIRRVFAFKSYIAGADWARNIAVIAENENHHPEIRILWRKVVVELWTHTVKGLSENDFILAAKFDRNYLYFTKP